MTKKNQHSAKSKKPGRGRPTRYKSEYCDLAKNYCLLGATDVELAEFFGVTEKTLNNWKHSHPDFLQSLKEGKVIADARVAGSLYHRAMGYSHPEDKIFQYEGSPVVVPTVKHYPPDTTAGIFWLKNRRKEDWRDKQDHEHTGPDGGAIPHAVVNAPEKPKTIAEWEAQIAEAESARDKLKDEQDG